MIPSESFYRQDCLTVSRALVGMQLCRREESGSVRRLRILETEAYCGEGDTACHAHKGRTARTEVMYASGGTLYVYLCYGIHWMLNIVTGVAEDPQAVLIRSCDGAEGPGRLTKALGIDRAFNGRSILRCPELWIEDDGCRPDILTLPRVGIGYAAPEDQARPWRFVLKKD